MSDHHSIHFSREAFLHPVNLGFLLTVSFLAYLFSGTSWMPTILFSIGLGLELIYLGTVPQQPWFRRHIVSRRDEEYRRSGRTEKAQFDQLGTKNQKRFLAFRSVYDKILVNFDRLPDSSRPLTGQLTERLDQMKSEYLAHLLLQERYREYLEHASPESITIEIRNLKKEMAAVTSDRLREVKQRRLQILEKRLTRHHVAAEKAEICRSQQETMEDAIRYVLEKSITMTHPGELDGHLDRLVSELEETAAIIQDIDDDIPPTYTVLNQLESQP
ncbi:MAG: hypothetical protein R6U28_09605 [Cyclonatronaceae bacterium]